MTKNPIRHKGNGITEVFLADDKIVLIDTDDCALVAPYKWRAELNKGTYYARAYNPSGQPKNIRMHRLLLPEATRVDHKNHNGLDNQRSNLRAVTNSVNMLNRRSLKHAGVIFRPDRPKCWVAAIKVDGKTTKRYFYTKEEAKSYAREMRVILDSILDT